MSVTKLVAPLKLMPPADDTLPSMLTSPDTWREFKLAVVPVMWALKIAFELNVAVSCIVAGPAKLALHAMFRVLVERAPPMLALHEISSWVAAMVAKVVVPSKEIPPVVTKRPSTSMSPATRMDPTVALDAHSKDPAMATLDANEAVPCVMVGPWNSAF